MAKNLSPEERKRLQGIKNAIVQFKAEYGVGSQSGHQYLKVYNQYLELSKEIGAELRREGINYSPSQRETSNLCATGQNACGLVLQALTGKKEIEEDGYCPLDYFVIPLPNYTHKDFISIPTLDDNKRSSDWKMDYPFFLTRFFSRFVDDKNTQNAMRKVFLLDGIDGGYAWLESPTGKKMTFRQFEAQIPILSFSDSDEKEKILQPGQFALNLFKRWALEGVNYNLKGYGEFKLDNITEEEKDFLFGKKDANGQGLYGRASNEMQLGNMWIERRIALNQVLSRNGNAESIDEILEDMKHLSKSRKTRLGKLKTIKAPKKIVEREEMLVERVAYESVAIKKIGNGLKEFYLDKLSSAFCFANKC